MDDQELLRDLARAALDEEAAERGRWERWDHLNDGALSAEEETELRALAATSIEAEKAYEAFRPFSPDFRARVVAAIGPLGVAEPAPAPAAPPAPPARVEEPRPIQGRGRPWRSRFLGWSAGLGSSGLAAAAALFLLLRLPALPEFRVMVAGASAWRGAAGETFTPGGSFEVHAVPTADLPRRAPLEPRCFVGHANPSAGRLRPVDCAVTERDERGAVQIKGHLPESLPTEPATLWIVLAYPGHQPPPDTLENLPVDTRSLAERWIALPQAIEIRAP